jgi:hypothetical protein
MRALLGLLCFLSFAPESVASAADTPGRSQKLAEMQILLAEISSKRLDGEPQDLPDDVATAVDLWMSYRNG